MKILVLSDSHGNIDNMIQAVERESPRAIFHLGDCWRDGQRLHQRFPELPFEQVPGNCDFLSQEAAERLVCLEDKRILLCHGHTYGVKQSLIAAGYAAEEQNLDVFHPPPPGGHAGQGPLSESRQHRGLCPSLLRSAHHLRRQGRRPDRSPGLIRFPLRPPNKF